MRMPVPSAFVTTLRSSVTPMAFNCCATAVELIGHPPKSIARSRSPENIRGKQRIVFISNSPSLEQISCSKGDLFLPFWPVESRPVFPFQSQNITLPADVRYARHQRNLF